MLFAPSTPSPAHAAALLAALTLAASLALALPACADDTPDPMRRIAFQIERTSQVENDRVTAIMRVTHDDVDMLMFYDSFTITCLILLESLGFVPRGEGGPFVAEGHLKRGGKWPLNTDGGGLSSCHPGMRGIFLILESVRQLRGQAGDAQVPDCEVALAAGSGGWLSCIGVVILGKDAPS